MRRLTRLLPLGFVFLLAGSAPLAGLAEVFCNSSGVDGRTYMPSTTDAPWGAVGYIDNGCTGTLIDPQHVLAAGHCFTWANSGAWQANLYFSPNFSPGTPPRFVAVDRAVVGTRADSGTIEGPKNDWGIGHLAKPVTDFPSLAVSPAPSLPAPAMSAGYGRDLAKVHPHPPPPGAPCANPFCTSGQNVWWDQGLVDPACTIWTNDDNFLHTDCAAVGGNSGSPLVRLSGGSYTLAGVIRGGGASVDRSTTKVTGCTQLTLGTIGLLNDGPAAQRFVAAPTLVRGVGVTRAGPEATRSDVYAVDYDSGKTAVRTRAGAGLGDPFLSWRSTGPETVGVPFRLAVLSQPSGYPLLVVADQSGRLWTRRGLGPGTWEPWRRLSLPRKRLFVRDIDALEAGPAELYVVTTDGSAYRRRIVETQWGKWLKISGPGAFTAITAVRREDGARVVVETGSPAGAAFLRAQTGSGWGAPFAAPVPFGQAIDVDLTRDRSGALRAFAFDPSGGLRTRSAADGSTWSAWMPWEVRLFAPLVANEATASPDALAYGYWKETTGPPLDGVVQLEATQWVEPGTDDATVVFALDFRGNLYFTEPRCKTGPDQACPAGEYWRGWRSFY